MICGSLIYGWRKAVFAYDRRAYIVFSIRNGSAMALARDAKDNAIRAEMAASALAVELRSHVLECAKSWERLDRNMARSAEERSVDFREWREDLGRRLDRQDRIQLNVLAGVAAILVSALGFLIAHLNLFHLP